MKDGKVCLKCGKPKADSAFFKSSSSYHKDGLVPICRKCIIDDVYDPDTGAMDIGSFEEILRQLKILLGGSNKVGLLKIWIKGEHIFLRLQRMQRRE